MKLERSLVGACGVFYVSAELSRRGWVAMPTIRNTRGIDIIAAKGGRDVSIQVKTNSYGKTKYPMSKGNEELIGDNLFYVLVTLKGENEHPDFYVVPSQLVASYIKETHRKFVSMKPTRMPKGKTVEEVRMKRGKSSMRQFPNRLSDVILAFRDFDINDYKDKWSLLG